MDDERVIYSCLEHIEMALDDYINEIEDAPSMQECEDVVCNYCTNKAAYKLFK